MKKVILNIVGALFVGLAFMACSPEDFDGANGNLPVVSDYSDNFSVTVDQSTNIATFSFNEAPGVTPYWRITNGSNVIISGETSFSQRFSKKGEYQVECRVKNRNGISDGAIEKTVVINRTLMAGFPGFKKDSGFNLLEGATFGEPGQYYAVGDNWEQQDNPAWSVKDGVYTVTYPKATSQRWQAQFALTLTSALKEKIVADKHYDFSVIVTTSKAHPGIKLKVCNADGDAPVLDDEDFATEAEMPTALWFSDVEGQDIDQLKIIFDFGGCADNTVVTIEDFVLKDHANDDGSDVPSKEIPVNWCAVDAPENLGAGFNTKGAMSFWWADAGWGQLGDPGFSYADGVYTITATENGGGEWQAQSSIPGVEIEMEEGAFYDIKCKVVASAEVGRYTLKICQDDDDDNALYYNGNLKLNEGENTIAFTHLSMSKGAASSMKWIFDFGGIVPGTEVKVSDIILQKHNPK